MALLKNQQTQVFSVGILAVNRSLFVRLASNQVKSYNLIFTMSQTITGKARHIPCIIHIQIQVFYENRQTITLNELNCNNRTEQQSNSGQI